MIQAYSFTMDSAKTAFYITHHYGMSKIDLATWNTTQLLGKPNSRTPPSSQDGDFSQARFGSK